MFNDAPERFFLALAIVGLIVLAGTFAGAVP
jgi:hypothetical protein